MRSLVIVAALIFILTIDANGKELYEFTGDRDLFICNNCSAKKWSK